MTTKGNSLARVVLQFEPNETKVRQRKREHLDPAPVLNYKRQMISLFKNKQNIIFTKKMVS